MKKRQKSKRWAILDSAFFRVVVTVAFIEFSQVGAGLIDGIITSRSYGADAMAAVGIGYPIFSICGLLSGILALGMQSVSSKEIGKGNYRSFCDIFTMSIFVVFSISLITTCLAFVFCDPLVILLGAKDPSSELFRLTKSYVTGLFFGLPALFSTPILAPAIQMDNNAGLVRWAAFINAIANAVFDILTVKFGMGLLGMGLATSISACANLIVLLFHFTKKDRMLHFRLNLSSFRTLLEILPNGAIVGVRRLANIIRPLIINNYIIALGGTAAMSALSVKNNVSSFGEILGTGVAGAIPMLMGIAVGEKRIEDILHIGKLTHRYTLFGNGAIAVILILFAAPLASFYVEPGSELYKMVMFSFRIMAVELALQTLLASRVTYLNVISKRRDSQLLQFGIRLLAIIPSVLIMGKLFGVYGVLSGFAVGYLLLIAAVYVANAIYCKSPKVTARDYLRLDQSYDIAPGDVIDLDIRNMEDAAIVSEQVHLFARGHKLDKTKCYYASLAVEESARLIYESNHFSPDINIDLRLVIQGENLIIRIRDSGSSAYPFGGLTSDAASDDPCANIGIKMIRKAAKDITYYHTLNINYTIITV